MVNAFPRLRRLVLCRAAWLVALAATGGLRADTAVPVPTEPESGITLRLTSPFAAAPRFGFLPVRVAVENLAKNDGAWRFRFEGGGRGVFPGIMTSAFEVAVPAAQTREVWFFVPVAEPGVFFNPASFLPQPVAGALVLPSVPPIIPGIYPASPPGVGAPQVTFADTERGGVPVRTFTITQKGPEAAIKASAPGSLPGATIQLTPPDSAGEVTRRTTLAVEAVNTASANANAVGIAAGRRTAPAQASARNASARLSAANLTPAGVRSSVSSRITPGATPGTNLVTLTIRQFGPPTLLALPPPNSLPEGFTDVTLNDGNNPGEVVREFTYVETIAVGTGGRVAAPARQPAAVEAEARRILVSTQLLEVPPTVRSRATVSTQGTSVGPLSLVTLFEQTGPQALLPGETPTPLPAGVHVSLHPAPTAGEITRVIAVVDRVSSDALQAALAPGRPNMNVVLDGPVLARMELARLGYWRTLPGVQQRFSIRGGTGAGGPDTLAFTETGPAALLPLPPAGALPPSIKASVVPAQGGQVQRTLTVSIPVLAPGLPGGAAKRRAAPGTLPPGTPWFIEVSGPGVPGGTARLSFPAAPSNPMPPVAIAAGLEAAARAGLADAGMKAAPNFVAVEPAQLPADWRMWSSFNGVVLKADEFAGLDAGRRAALRGWASLGGVVVLVPASAGQAGTETVGTGRIETLAGPLADLPARDLVAALQLDALAPGLPDREQLRFIRDTPMDEIVRFEPDGVLWISLFLVGFAVVIGPVNLFLLAPAAKRHRLFVTTPVISLLGAVAVAGAIVLRDGLGGKGARRALVVLVPGDNQAAVFQEQAAQTGFLPRREFALGDGVLCSVVPPDEQMFANPLAPGVLHREQGRAGGEWFANRSRQGHLLRQLAPTRARIECVDTEAGGAPVVESTLPTELRDFRLRDDRGGYWMAASVPPGRRITLAADPQGADRAEQEARDGTENFAGLAAAAGLRGAWTWRAQGGPTDVAPIATLRSVRWTDDITYAGVAERRRPNGPAKGGS